MYPTSMGEKKIVELKVASVTECFSVPRAAEELDIEPAVMRNYLSQGLFTTYKFQGLTLVHVNEIEAWKKEHQK